MNSENETFFDQNKGQMFLAAGDLVKLIGYEEHPEDLFWVVSTMHKQRELISCAIRLVPMTLEPNDQQYLDTLLEWNGKETGDIEGAIKIKVMSINKLVRFKIWKTKKEPEDDDPDHLFALGNGSSISVE